MSTLLVKNFKAGRMLDSDGWAAELASARAYRNFEGWVAKAIAEKEVDLLHPCFVRTAASVTETNPIYFNGTRYETWDSLVYTDIGNYSGAAKLNLNILASWVEAGIIERVPKEDLDKVIYNPIQVVEGAMEWCGNEWQPKLRPVLHLKVNALAKKLDTKLPRVATSIAEIEGMQSAFVVDGRKMYWQIPISTRSRNACAFQFGGLAFRSKVVFFGASMATHICQTLMEIWLGNFRLQVGGRQPTTAVGYVDDFLGEEKRLRENV